MQAKIIFFIPDSNPSKDEQLAAANIPGHVVYRNLRYIGEEDKPEECDGVFSLTRIPKNYRHLPDAEKAIEAKREAHLAKLAKTGDSPAPGSKFEQSEKNRIRKQANKAEMPPPGAPQGAPQGAGVGTATDPAASVGSPQGAAQTAGAWGGSPQQ
jgi:hypothetical protein